MGSFTCPICGGKLNIKNRAEFAVCDSCGNITGLDPAYVAKIRAIYQSVEHLMRLNSTGGYRKAIRDLEAIAFIDEARELSDECKRRLNALLSKQKVQQEVERETGKRNTVLGVILLVFTLLFCAAAVIGLVYLIIRIASGGLALRTSSVIIGVTVVAIVLIVVSRLK